MILLKIAFETNPKSGPHKRNQLICPIDIYWRPPKRRVFYTIIEHTELSSDSFWSFLALNPSKTRLAFADYGKDRGVLVQIFDLATKRCIQYFTFDQIPGERDDDYFVWSLNYFDSVVVVYTLRVVRVFAETGELLHQFHMRKQGQRELKAVKGATGHGQVLYLNLEDGIFSFDIDTGVSNKIVAFENIDNPVLELVGVQHGRWLVAAAERYLQCGFKTQGRFFTKVTQCTENPSIFYALPLPSVSSSEDRGNVWELSTEGKLSRVSSFPVSIHGSLCCNFDRRIALREDLALRDPCPNSGVHVINTIDGKVEGSLAVPGYDIRSIVPNGTEMFVALREQAILDPAHLLSLLSFQICSCEKEHSA